MSRNLVPSFESLKRQRLNLFCVFYRSHRGLPFLK